MALPLGEITPAPPPSGRAPFGRYVLERRLAAGGMGEVWRAVAIGERGFAKPVVLKRVLPAHTGRQELAELFVAEAKIMTHLAHPNVVEVLDFGRGDEGDYFLVLELVHGLDLGRLQRWYRLRGEPFPLGLALYMTTQVLRGLQYAHTRAEGGLVHRDISPGNVLLSTEGEVKVADFGVALVRRSDAPAKPGSVVGKPGYMAPEQWEGRVVDPRADLFSVAVVLFELLAAELPFRGTSLEAVRASARVADLKSLGELRPGLPPSLEGILRRALSPVASDRFGDARGMAQALEALRAEGAEPATVDDVADVVRAAIGEASRELEAAATEVESVPDLAALEAASTLLGRELTRHSSTGGGSAFTWRVPTVGEEGHRTVRLSRELRVEAITEGPPAVPAPAAAPRGPDRRRVAFGVVAVGLLLGLGLLTARLMGPAAFVAPPSTSAASAASAPSAPPPGPVSPSAAPAP